MPDFAHQRHKDTVVPAIKESPALLSLARDLPKRRMVDPLDDGDLQRGPTESTGIAKDVLWSTLCPS